MGAGSVLAIATATNTLVRRISVGGYPEAIAITPSAVATRAGADRVG
jgi:YVTN family beta-propeller protein